MVREDWMEGAVSRNEPIIMTMNARKESRCEFSQAGNMYIPMYERFSFMLLPLLYINGPAAPAITVFLLDRTLQLSSRLCVIALSV